MRYGVCGNLCAKGTDSIGLTMAVKAAEAGFDYVEMPVGDMLALPETERKDAVRNIKVSGIDCDVMNNFFPRELKLTGPLVDRERIREYYRCAFELADSLGCRKIVFGSPFAKSYPLGFDPSEAYWQLQDLTKEIDNYAHENNFSIIIEPIHRFESNLINTFAEGIRFIDEIEAKATGVMVDYYHMHRNGENYDELKRSGKGCLKHIHFASPFHPGEGERVFPLDLREWDYGPFAEVIREIGYDETVSIEARTTDFNKQGRIALNVLKELFS